MSDKSYFGIDNNRLYYVLLPVVVFIIVPGFVLQQNFEGFSSLDGKFTLSLLAIACVMAIAGLFLVGKLLSLVKGEVLFGGAIRFATYFLTCTGLIVPLSVESGMVDPANIPIDWLNLVIAIGVAILLTLLSLSQFKKFLAIALYCFLGINLLTSLQAFYRLAYQAESLDKSIYAASSVKNVFVISFDGLPRDATIEVLRENPGLQQQFRDFTVYENVISSSPATIAAIFAELRGNRDYKQEYTTTQDLKQADPSAQITNYLDEHGFRVSTYGDYNRGFQNLANAHNRGTLAHLEQERVSEALDFFDYAVVRLGSSLLVIRDGIIGAARDKLAFTIAGTSDQTILQQITRHKGEHWDKKFILTKYDFDRYLEKLHVTGEQPVAHFMHLTHTHFPVDFDRDCVYRSSDASWFRKHQNRAGAKEEIHCALSQFAQFIGKLQDLGIYDNSLVVFKSDHGKPIRYHDPDKLESFSIRGHQLWGYGRYTPFLAVKAMQRHSDDVTYNEQPVMIDDLAKTICINAGDLQDCSHYPGFDLLAAGLEIPDDARSVIFIARNQQSNHYFDTHESLVLNRDKDFYRQLNSVLSDDVLKSPIACHKRIPLDRGSRWNNGLTDGESWVSWHHERYSSLKFRPADCQVRRLNIWLKAGGEQLPEYGILVNGVSRKHSLHSGENGDVLVVLQLDQADLSQPALQVEVQSNIEGHPEFVAVQLE